MFGDAVDGEMVLNSIGEIASEVWKGIPERFPLVNLDAFVVMPNHIHGIIVINEDSMQNETPACVRAQFIAPLSQRRQTSAPLSNSAAARQGAINCARTNPKALGNIIRVFKAVATDRIRRSRMPDFRWHRNYYDHIIRNEKDLDRI
jgi:REP element-mobilizing transposase RayT